MIISVWNQEDQDNSRVFTTLLASIATLSYKRKVTIYENSMGDKLLGDMMLGNTYSERLKEEGAWVCSKGAGGTIVPYVQSKYLRSARSKNMVEIVCRHLYYIPQYNDGSKIVFDLNFYDKMYEYKEEAQKISDHIIIATAKEESFTTPRVLGTADRVVVLIPFNEDSISRFLDRYKSIKSRCILVQFVHEDMIRNKRRISKMMKGYGFSTSQYRILGFTDKLDYAIRKGNVIDYIRDCIENRDKNPEELPFINSLQKLCIDVFGRKELGLAIRSTTIHDVLKKRDPDTEKTL